MKCLPKLAVLFMALSLVAAASFACAPSGAAANQSATTSAVSFCQTLLLQFQIDFANQLAPLARFRRAERGEILNTATHRANANRVK